MRKLLIVSLISGAAMAGAQVSLPQFGLAYHQSNSFDLNGGGSGRLSGLELSVSQSVVSLPLFGDARVGFAYLLNGSFGGGSSAEGNLWRLYAEYQTPSGISGGIYGLTGFYYASATGRNGSFDSQTGVGFEVGLGIPLSAPVPGKIGGMPGVPKIALEFKYFQGGRAALRGFSVGAIVHF